MKKLNLVILTFFLNYSWVYAQMSNDNMIASDIETYCQKVLEETPGLPGFAISVVKNDEVILEKGFGTADLNQKLASTANTNYYIASSTKSFTALLAMILDEEGIILLDDPLSKYFPDTYFVEELKVDEIKIRDLFTHTAGISNEPIAFRLAYTGEHDLETLIELMQFSEPNEAGLGNYQYTNLGYNIYTVILDKITGKSWQDWLNEKVFIPLGMDRTTAYMSLAENNNWDLAKPYFASSESTIEEVYLMKKDNTMQSAGGLITTAEDMSKWLEVQMNLGLLDGTQVFSEEMIKASHQLLTEQEKEKYHTFDTKGYGMGWSIAEFRGKDILHHFGGFPGFLTHVSFMPEEKIGITVMVNEAVSGWDVMNLIAKYSYDVLLSEDVDSYEKELENLAKDIDKSFESIQKGVESRAKRTWQLSKPFSEYEGVFFNGKLGTVQISVINDEIKVEMGNMHCIATPFTEQETIRVELSPGSGEVLQFMWEEDTLNVIRLAGYNFDRVN